jgi:serine/threonine protein kinase
MRRAPSSPPELPGYEFVRLIGNGGFADVFLYEQQLPKRKVAVKVLLIDELNDASHAAFIAEANLMAQLSAHPYIVTIFNAGVAGDGRPFLVMEYCSGASLGERYKREVFTVADALRTGVRLSSAIATAHSVGILHRDIKPANVLTNDYGWPALTDFGISSTLDDELPVHTMTSGALNATGTAGTTGSQSVGMSIPWSPAEMFEDDPQPDVRSDVFSLAATIHTLLAGRTPFEIAGRSNGTLDLVGRIERGAITPIERDDIPRSLTAVLQKGMATKRADRFASAVDFARALQRVELELGYSPTGIEVPNLDIAPVERDDELSKDDETRVRSVATINAQAPQPEETRVRNVTYITPPALTPGATPAPVFQPSVDEHTLVRQRPVAQAPVAAPAIEVPATSAPPAPTAPKSKRGLVTAIISGVVVVALGAVVAAAVLSSGAGVREQPTATAPGAEDPSAIGGEIVPQPTDGTSERSSSGTAVTFSWANPDPVDGDTYRYARSEQPSALSAVGEESTVTIEDLAKNQRQCVLVYIYRAGQLSIQPLEICNPE